MIDNQIFCFNCYGLYEKGLKKQVIQKYQCCDNPNILETAIQDICRNFFTIHMKFDDKPTYLENDEYQTNILFKRKKVHEPYKYLKKIYPKIKYTKIYDFILESIQFIQDSYKFKNKPFFKYTPYLYNYYQERNHEIPFIPNFIKNKDLILDEEVINKINEIYFKYSDTEGNIKELSKVKKSNINDKSVNDKYYYFNKSKNQYFKKTRYCQFENCIKIGNFRDSNNFVKNIVNTL